jgi:hypothetical protein
VRHLTLVGDAAVLPHATRRWIESETKYVAIDIVPAGRADVAGILPGVDPATLDGRLTAVDDEGNLWRDGAAELLVLWALRRYRARALKIGHPSRLPFRSHNLNWVSGGGGRAWEERSEHVGGGESK